MRDNDVGEWCGLTTRKSVFSRNARAPDRPALLEGHSIVRISIALFCLLSLRVERAIPSCATCFLALGLRDKQAMGCVVWCGGWRQEEGAIFTECAHQNSIIVRIFWRTSIVSLLWHCGLVRLRVESYLRSGSRVYTGRNAWARNRGNGGRRSALLLLVAREAKRRRRKRRTKGEWPSCACVATVSSFAPCAGILSSGPPLFQIFEESTPPV